MASLYVITLTTFISDLFRRWPDEKRTIREVFWLPVWIWNQRRANRLVISANANFLCNAKKKHGISKKNPSKKTTNNASPSYSLCLVLDFPLRLMAKKQGREEQAEEKQLKIEKLITKKTQNTHNCHRRRTQECGCLYHWWTGSDHAIFARFSPSPNSVR